MTKLAFAALAIIRACLDDERYIVTQHFSERMDERAIFWPDVLIAIESPTEVRDAGSDKLGRPKWIVVGPTTDDLSIEIVCVLDEDDSGNMIIFITLYWD